MSLRLKTLKGRRGLLLANLNRIPQRYYSQLVLDDFSYEDQKINHLRLAVSNTFGEFYSSLPKVLLTASLR